MKYEAYFEFFGRKMKHTVEAISEADAKRIIANKIKFHKVRPVDDVVDFFSKTFGFRK